MSNGIKAFDLRRVVVIDTSPLFNALALMYIRSSPIYRRHLKHALPHYLRNNPTRETDFLRLFDSIRTMITTSHVIGELQNILKKSGLPQGAFWEFSMPQLSKIKLAENLIMLLDMYKSDEMRKLVCAIGPIDAGLIVLAKREKAIILTDDKSTLAHYALGMPDIECKLVEFIL